MIKKATASSARDRRREKNARPMPDSRIDLSDIPEATDKEWRRARRNSSSVASGISERSIRLSGIGLPFFPRRLPRADDANAFFPIFQPPWRVRDHQASSRDGIPQPLRPPFRLVMLRIIPIQRF